MAGSVLDPLMPTEDSEHNESDFEDNTVEETKNIRDSNSEAEDISRDPPSTADIEKGITKETNEESKKQSDSAPLVHMGGQPTKDHKSAKSPTAFNEQQSKQEPTSDSQDDDDSIPSGMSTRSKVMIYFCFCLSIVFILQGIIIGMLMEGNDQNNENKNSNRVASNIGEAGLTEPPMLVIATPTPTFSPTIGVVEPSPPPSYMFRSIASIPGAFLWNDSCDDCSAVIYPGPDDRLQWDSFSWINEVVIDSNGFFTLNCQLYGICGKIDVTGGLDLAPNINGNIYGLWGREPRRTGSNTDHPSHSTTMQARQRPIDEITTLTLSWEDVSLFGYSDYNSEFRINAQVKISQQEVVFCYGEGHVDGATFRSGISNYTNGFEFTPVGITGFDSDGFSTTFPKNTCEAKILSSS